MLHFFFLFLVVALSAYGILKIISFYRVLYHIEKIKKDIKTETLDNSKKLVLILPVYEETQLIDETIQFFLPLLNENITLIISGTAKERNSMWANPTLELARKYNNNYLKVIEYPEKNGYMAHQINFVIKHLLSEWFDTNNTRIHMINIDTRTPKNYLPEVINHLNRNHTILLQSAMFTLNFDQVWLLQKWTSLVQCARTITGEQRRLLLCNLVSKWKLYHVVGHGLIINLATFIQYRWFPEDTFNEDMHFGYYLSICGEKVYPLSSYEIADMPATFWGRWKQTQGRFIGSMEYHKYCASYLKKFNKKMNTKVFIMTLQGFYNAFKRLVVSYVMIAILAWIVLMNNFYLGIAGVISIVLYMSHERLTMRYLYKQKYIEHSQFVYMLSTFIIICVRSIPATIALIKYIANEIGIYSYIKYKSTHE